MPPFPKSLSLNFVHSVIEFHLQSFSQSKLHPQQLASLEQYSSHSSLAFKTDVRLSSSTSNDCNSFVAPWSHAFSSCLIKPENMKRQVNRFKTQNPLLNSVFKHDTRKAEEMNDYQSG